MQAAQDRQTDHITPLVFRHTNAAKWVRYLLMNALMRTRPIEILGHASTHLDCERYHRPLARKNRWAGNHRGEKPAGYQQTTLVQDPRRISLTGA